MKRKLTMLFVSIAMIASMVLPGTKASAAVVDLPAVAEWTGFSNGVSSKDPVTFNFTDSQDGNEDWASCVSHPVTWKEGASYQVSIDVESTLARKMNVGPEGMTRSRYLETLIDIPAGRTIVKNTFTIPSGASQNLFIFMGRKVQGQDVYMYEAESGDHSVMIYSVSLVEVDDAFILENGTDQEILDYYGASDSYASSLTEQLSTLVGSSFKEEVVKAIKTAGEGATLKDAVLEVAEKNKIPVPKGVGYQTQDSSSGCKDMRFVFSIADSSRYEVKEVGVLTINPYWVGNACRGTDIDAVRANMVVGGSSLIKGGAINSVFRSVSGVVEGATEKDDILYMTLKAENLAGNVVDQNMPARAYVVLATDGGEVTVYSDVAYGTTVANGAAE
ncbi:MAG: hypothetical protein ACI4CT_04535 [Lachnospiraceae bacterium]